MFKGVKAALAEIVRNSKSDSAFSKADIRHRADLLNANIELLEQWRLNGNASSEKVTSFLQQIDKALDETVETTDVQLISALKSLNETGLSLAKEAGAPYIASVTPSLLIRTSGEINFRVAGSRLYARPSGAQLDNAQCRTTAIQDGLDITCPPAVAKALPDSPVSGDWYTTIVGLEVERPALTWLDRFLARSEALARVTLPVGLVPSFSGTFAVVVSEPTPNAETRQRSAQYTFRGDSCTARSFENRVVTPTNDDWSIDPTSVIVRTDVQHGSQTFSPSVSEVGPSGFTLSARVGGRCVPLLFGTKVSIPSLLVVTASWKEIRAGLGSRALISAKLIKWSEEQEIELPTASHLVGLEMHRSDGAIDRGQLRDGVETLTLPWMTATMSVEGARRKLLVKTVDAQEAVALATTAAAK